jgi:hypothetical protein
MTFPTISSAIAYLRDEHRRWAETLGLPSEGTITAQELVSGTTPQVANTIIDKIEQELLPLNRYEIAEDLLAEIIKHFDHDTQLVIRAGKLLAHARAPEEYAREARTPTRDKRFHTLQDESVQRKVSKIADRIRDRRCVLELR